MLTENDLPEDAVVITGAEAIAQGIAPPEIIEEEAAPKSREEYEAEAKSILEHEDPASLYEPEIRRIGYGGDIRPPLMVVIAATTRLLAKGGTMPAHLGVIAPASVGKSWAVKRGLDFLPDPCKVVVNAGSPKALIYGGGSLKHVVLLVAEADSIPKGDEEGPASSAIRNLCTDGEMSYDVTQQDPKTKQYKTRHVFREGPTVLMTTSTRSLGEQMMSRLYVIDMPDDHQQLQASLAAQAQVELDGFVQPNPALVAYQGYLQTLAPWRVVVPFADWLASEIGRNGTAPRLNRDFGRLLSLIKAVTILRHAHRDTDAQGRLLAEIEDYEFVYNLVKDYYAASVTAVTPAIQNAVEIVAHLKSAAPTTTVNNVAVFRQWRGKVSQKTVDRYIGKAIGHGWLVNESPHKRRYDLHVGSPLPDDSALPNPKHYGLDPDFIAHVEAQRAAAPTPNIVSIWATKEEAVA